MQSTLSNFYHVNMSAIKMGSKGAPGHNDRSVVPWWEKIREMGWNPLIGCRCCQELNFCLGVGELITFRNTQLHK
jgi:hypothetical protein